MNIETITKGLKKDLESLSEFNATKGNGTTRLPFTKEARDCVKYLSKIMQEAGLTVHNDEAGNVIGTLQGEDKGAPAIVMGSHYDSVVNGGNFDGIAGVVCGIEIARLIRDTGVKLKRNFTVIGFCDEEGMRFGTGFFGSKGILGQLDLEYLHKYKDKDGISIYEAMKQYGLMPGSVEKAKMDMDKIKAYIEIHPEQGPVLDAKKIELGLVECIVGMQRYMVTVNGRADHAGTTPMDMRIDAVDVSTKVISKIADWAREKNDGTVATTGFMRVCPSAMNIVAEKVEFSIDVRSKHEENIRDIVSKIKAALKTECEKCGATYEMNEKLKISPVHLNEEMLSKLAKNCEARGYSYQRILSGAGHDALPIGQVVDTVMVFAPSKDGRSHCPVEWTEYSDLAKAVAITYDLIIDMQ
ncbi:Zn-dependent hydrolase [Petroclostridium sp. X23]|nr:Zn-dependent hydrolase [Petroclostridium sp. X23]WHH61643.1 Zn-dependent hydrolase [Petroclostridium sp. X23]